MIIIRYIPILMLIGIPVISHLPIDWLKLHPMKSPIYRWRCPKSHRASPIVLILIFTGFSMNHPAVGVPPWLWIPFIPLPTHDHPTIVPIKNSSNGSEITIIYIYMVDGLLYILYPNHLQYIPVIYLMHIPMIMRFFCSQLPS